MKRDAINYLRRWRNDPIRVPLLLRGARQVGKSWLAQCFGDEFSSYIAINFEKDRRVHALFTEHVDIKAIVEKLAAYTGKKIVPGETLLFLDEIQECPHALKYLRYFKEEMSELHVMAAGSLIDFALEKFGIAVGRVDYLYVYPLSFLEFLTASSREDLRALVQEQDINLANHDVLLELLRHYLWLGGMPAVVDAWLHHRDPSICQRLQDRIIENYEDDFQKYARKNQIDSVQRVFRAIPQQLGNKFTYKNVDADSQAYPLKQALSLLVKAGVAHRCFHTSGQHYPLGADMDERKFKIFLFDVGIAQRMLGLDLATWISQPVELKYLGSSAEQLVAQEFIAYSPANRSAQLFYWHNESKSRNAEVDFVTLQGKNIIPVEVKSGIKGGMKSLKVFLDTHPQTPYGLKISEGCLAQHAHLREIPLYGIAGWLSSSEK